MVDAILFSFTWAFVVIGVWAFYSSLNNLPPLCPKGREYDFKKIYFLVIVGGPVFWILFLFFFTYGVFKRT